jgi:hypothetical protein
MRASRPAVSLVALAGCVLAMAGASGQGPAASTEWKADPASTKKLDKVVPVEEYTIQPPKGYAYQETDGPMGSKMRAWAGPIRKDTSRPSLTLSVLAIPATELAKIKELSLEQLGEKMLAAVKARRTDWKQEKPEAGMVNGIKFVRIRWTGVATVNNREMKGFQYVAVDGKSIVQIASQDFAPESDASLKLAEAAVLTFKRK